MANVKVAVRVRPSNKRELDNGAKIIVEIKNDTIRVINPKIPENSEVDSREKFKRFVFDYLFWSSSSLNTEVRNASQEEIFQELGTDILEAILDGYNACVLAYGQSGSGKTYTMMGQDNEIGLIPRLCKALFMRLDDVANGKVTFHIDVSFLEIYNEKVRDLLQTPANKKKSFKLKVREHPKLGTYVQDLSRHKVNDYQTVLELIGKGNDQRSIAVTENHHHSSRSHAIFTINFTQAKLDADLPSEIISKIHLVDLAGSERASNTFNKIRLKESSNINKSLVTLGNVISALADKSLSTWSLDSLGSSFSINSSASESVATSPLCSPRRMRHPFVPYRDSVLTWLLKDCLGGNSKTLMITTISPASTCYNETISTLRYAQRTKCIVNRPVVNEDPNVKLIRQLRAEVYRLRKLLTSARINNVLPSTVDENSITEILNQNENKAKVLTKSWFAKWQYSLNIIEDSGHCFNEHNSEYFVNSSLPHLIVLDNHILSTGIHIYPLKKGKTIINKAVDLSENSSDTETDKLTEYCHIHFDGITVTLIPSNKQLCQINGKNVIDAVQLRQADIIKLGNNYTLRFNHPSEIQKLKAEWPSDKNFYGSNLSTEQVLPSEKVISSFFQSDILESEKILEVHNMNDLQSKAYEKGHGNMNNNFNEDPETSPEVSSSSFNVSNSNEEHKYNNAERTLNEKNLTCNSERLIFSYANQPAQDILNDCACASKEMIRLNASGSNTSEISCNHLDNSYDFFASSFTDDQSNLCCAKCQSASHLHDNYKTFNIEEGTRDEMNPSDTIFTREHEQLSSEMQVLTKNFDNVSSILYETKSSSDSHQFHSDTTKGNQQFDKKEFDKNSMNQNMCNINTHYNIWNPSCHQESYLIEHLKNASDTKDTESYSSNSLIQQSSINGNVLINLPKMIDSSDSGIACCHNNEFEQIREKCQNSVDENTIWNSYFYHSSDSMNVKPATSMKCKEFHQETESVMSMLSEDFSESSSCNSMGHACQFNNRTSVVSSRPSTAPAAIRSINQEQLEKRLNKRVFSESYIPDTLLCATQKNNTCNKKTTMHKSVKKKGLHDYNGLTICDRMFVNKLMFAKIKRKLLQKCFSQAIKTFCATIKTDRVKGKEYHKRRNKVLCVKPKVKFRHKDSQSQWNFSSKLRTELVRAYLKNALLGIKKIAELKKQKAILNSKRTNSVKKLNFVLLDNKSSLGKEKEIYLLNDDSEKYIESSHHIDKDTTFNSELLIDVKNFVNFAKDITDSQQIIKVLEKTNNLKSTNSVHSYSVSSETSGQNIDNLHSLSLSLDKLSSDEQTSTITLQNSENTCKEPSITVQNGNLLIKASSTESLTSYNNQSINEDLNDMFENEKSSDNGELDCKAFKITSFDENTSLINESFFDISNKRITTTRIEQLDLLTDSSNLIPSNPQANKENSSFTVSSKTVRPFSPSLCFSLESDDISNISRQEIEIVPLSASAAIDSSRLLNVTPIADAAELKRSLSNTDIQKALQTEVAPTEKAEVDLTFCPSLSHAPKIRTNSWPEPSQLSLEQLDSEIRDLQEGLKEDLVNEVFVNMDQEGISVDSIVPQFIQSFAENTHHQNNLEEQFYESSTKNKETEQILNDCYPAINGKKDSFGNFYHGDSINRQINESNLDNICHSNFRHPPKKLVRQGARISLSVDTDQMILTDEDNSYSDDSLDGNKTNNENNSAASRILSSKSYYNNCDIFHQNHNTASVNQHFPLVRDPENLKIPLTFQNSSPLSSPGKQKRKEKRISLECLSQKPVDDASAGEEVSGKIRHVTPRLETNLSSAKNENNPPQVQIIVSEVLSDENNTANDAESWEIEGSFPVDNTSVAYTDDFESDDDDDDDDMNADVFGAEPNNASNEEEIEEEISSSVSDEEIYYIPADPANPNWSLYFKSTVAQLNHRDSVNYIENSLMPLNKLEDRKDDTKEEIKMVATDEEIKTNSFPPLINDSLNNEQRFPPIISGNGGLSSLSRPYLQPMSNNSFSDDGFFEAEAFPDLLPTNPSVNRPTFDTERHPTSSSPFSLNLSASDESSASSSSSCFDGWEHSSGADGLGSVGGNASGDDDIFAETLFAPLPPLDMLIDYRIMSPQDRRRLYTIPEMSSEYSSTPSESFGMQESTSEVENLPSEKYSTSDKAEHGFQIQKPDNSVESSFVDRRLDEDDDDENRWNKQTAKNDSNEDIKQENDSNHFSMENGTNDLLVDDCNSSFNEPTKRESREEGIDLVFSPLEFQLKNDDASNVLSLEINTKTSENCSETSDYNFTTIVTDEESKNVDTTIQKQKTEDKLNSDVGEIDSNTNASDCRELWKLYKRYSEESDEEEDEKKNSEQNELAKEENGSQSRTEFILATDLVSKTYSQALCELTEIYQIEQKNLTLCAGKAESADELLFSPEQKYEKTEIDRKTENKTVDFKTQEDCTKLIKMKNNNEHFGKIEKTDVNEIQTFRMEKEKTVIDSDIEQGMPEIRCLSDNLNQDKITEDQSSVGSGFVNENEISQLSNAEKRISFRVKNVDDLNENDEHNLPGMQLINNRSISETGEIKSVLLKQENIYVATKNQNEKSLVMHLNSDNQSVEENFTRKELWKPKSPSSPTFLKPVSNEENTFPNRVSLMSGAEAGTDYVGFNSFDNNMKSSFSSDSHSSRSFLTESYFSEDSILNVDQKWKTSRTVDAENCTYNDEKDKIRSDDGLPKLNIKKAASLKEYNDDDSGGVRLQGQLLLIDLIDLNNCEESNNKNFKNNFASNEKESADLNDEKERVENSTLESDRNHVIENVTGGDAALFSNGKEDQVVVTSCSPPTDGAVAVPHNGCLSLSRIPLRFSTDENNYSDRREEWQLDGGAQSPSTPSKTSSALRGGILHEEEVDAQPTPSLPSESVRGLSGRGRADGVGTNERSTVPSTDNYADVESKTIFRIPNNDLIKSENKYEELEHNATEDYHWFDQREKKIEKENKINYLSSNSVPLQEKLHFFDSQALDLFFLDDEFNFKNREQQPWSYKNWLFQPRLDCCIKGQDVEHSCLELPKDQRKVNITLSIDEEETDLVANEATVIAALGTSFHTDIFGEVNNSVEKLNAVDETESEQQHSALKNDENSLSVSSCVPTPNESQLHLEDHRHSLLSCSSRNKRESSITPDSLENVEQQQQLTSWSHHSVPGQQSLFTVRSSKPVNAGLSVLASSGPRDWGATAFEEFWAASSDSITFVFVGPGLPRSGKSSSDPSAADAFLRHFDDPSDPMPRSASLDCINRRQRCIGRLPYALNTRASSMESMIPEDLMSVVEQGRLHGVKSEQEKDVGGEKNSEKTKNYAFSSTEFNQSNIIGQENESAKKAKKKSVSWGDLSGCGLTMEEGMMKFYPPTPPPSLALKPIIKRLENTTASSSFEKNRSCEEDYTDDDVEEDLKKSPLFARIQRKCGAISGKPVVQNVLPSSFALKMPEHVKARMKRSKSEADVEKKSFLFSTSEDMQKKETEKANPGFIVSVEVDISHKEKDKSGNLSFDPVPEVISVSSPIEEKAKVTSASVAPPRSSADLTQLSSLMKEASSVFSQLSQLCARNTSTQSTQTQCSERIQFSSVRDSTTQTDLPPSTRNQATVATNTGPVWERISVPVQQQSDCILSLLDERNVYDLPLSPSVMKDFCVGETKISPPSLNSSFSINERLFMDDQTSRPSSLYPLATKNSRGIHLGGSVAVEGSKSSWCRRESCLRKELEILTEEKERVLRQLEELYNSVGAGGESSSESPGSPDSPQYLLTYHSHLQDACARVTRKLEKMALHGRPDENISFSAGSSHSLASSDYLTPAIRAPHDTVNGWSTPVSSWANLSQISDESARLMRIPLGGERRLRPTDYRAQLLDIRRSVVAFSKSPSRSASGSSVAQSSSSSSANVDSAKNSPQQPSSELDVKRNSRRRSSDDLQALLRECRMARAKAQKEIELAQAQLNAQRRAVKNLETVLKQKT